MECTTDNIRRRLYDILSDLNCLAPNGFGTKDEIIKKVKALIKLVEEEVLQSIN